MKGVYISGPMTGLPEQNYPAFHAAAAKLRALGLVVINPAEIASLGMSYNEIMRADIKALCDCDTLALLSGWESSVGAHLEMHLAHRLGIQVTHVDKLLHASTKSVSAELQPSDADL
jgi:hypothetical protein